MLRPTFRERRGLPFIPSPMAPLFMSQDRILLVLPLPLHSVGESILIDKQACTALGYWLDNFSSVTLMGPRLETASDGAAPASSIRGVERLEIIPLPEAWRPDKFVRTAPHAYRALTRQIRRADYLHFAIGGVWGDWGALACIIARQLKRQYAVWTDRVESQVVTFANERRTGLTRLYWSMNIALMKALERHVIKHSALGLFHGKDTFSTYAKFCSNPRTVYNITTGTEAMISDGDLQVRLQRTGPLQIIYAGRVHREKGVYDWIDVLSKLSIEFEATWFGDGPELDAVRHLVDGKPISFPGPISHSLALEQMRRSDLFLFCHKTLESPRCLIEALQSGLPLVGYSSPYQDDLIEGRAGLLTPIHDTKAVAGSLAHLNRDKLNQLSINAREIGAKYFAENIFKERAKLMRTLKARPAC